MSEFFAGNQRILLIKKQVDKATPVTDFSDALALRLTDFSPAAARTLSPLAETDSSVEEAASHVSAIGPSLSFGCYGRPSELDLIAEALLGENDDSSTSAPTTHTATPSITQPYYSILEVVPYGGGRRWEGCKLLAAQFASQDDGETALQVTGLQWEAITMTDNVSAPDPLPAFQDELPFIHAEATVKFATVHLGTTKQVTVQVNRNGGRAQGDSGFTALDIVPGKFATVITVSRYTGDNSMQRAVDTGSKTGTAPSSDVYTEGFSVLWSRGSGSTLRSFLITGTEVSYGSRDEADDTDGNPFIEVLGGRTEPQGDVADNMAMVTVNAKTTPDG
jgi:hypothetical protein